jgi:tetratricopeptide (TPR) repeat protein
MQRMNRFCLICTFLCAPFLGSGQEQLGDSLYALADYAKASVAYEYAFFSGESYRYANELLLKRTYCLKQLGRFEAAYQNLERGDFYNGSDSLRFLLFYESAISAMLAKQPDIALSKIQELKFEIRDSVLIEKVLPLEIVVLNELGRWQEAEAVYLVLAGNNGWHDNPYPAMRNAKLKNPKTAFTLSYFLPGVGQLYAGYFWKGAVSTLLNVGLVTFSGWSFLNGYFLSGTFTGVALFYLSYNGGARYAEVLANQYNAKKVSSFNQRVRNQLAELEAKK